MPRSESVPPMSVEALLQTASESASAISSKELLEWQQEQLKHRNAQVQEPTDRYQSQTQPAPPAVMDKPPQQPHKQYKFTLYKVMPPGEAKPKASSSKLSAPSNQAAPTVIRQPGESYIEAETGYLRSNATKEYMNRLQKEIITAAIFSDTPKDAILMLSSKVSIRYVALHDVSTDQVIALPDTISVAIISVSTPMNVISALGNKDTIPYVGLGIGVDATKIAAVPTDKTLLIMDSTVITAKKLRALRDRKFKQLYAYDQNIKRQLDLFINGNPEFAGVFMFDLWFPAVLATPPVTVQAQKSRVEGSVVHLRHDAKEGYVGALQDTIRNAFIYSDTPDTAISVLSAKPNIYGVSLTKNVTAEQVNALPRTVKDATIFGMTPVRAISELSAKESIVFVGLAADVTADQIATLPATKNLVIAHPSLLTVETLSTIKNSGFNTVYAVNQNIQKQLNQLLQTNPELANAFTVQLYHRPAVDTATSSTVGEKRGHSAANPENAESETLHVEKQARQAEVVPATTGTNGDAISASENNAGFFGGSTAVKTEPVEERSFRGIVKTEPEPEAKPGYGAGFHK